MGKYGTIKVTIKRFSKSYMTVISSQFLLYYSLSFGLRTKINLSLRYAPALVRISP